MIDKLLPTQRLRAHDAQDKAARREAILDAAERLYARAQSLPGVAEVAAEAGLAKGTMYLYFETKEAMYLGLHERHSQHFFEALIAALESSQPFDVDTMLALVDEHMIRNASHLPLGHVCLGASPDRIDAPTHDAFHRQQAEWLGRAGRGLERRLPSLRPGDGQRFLHHGYAMLLGLYQLLGQPSQCAMHARLHAAGTDALGPDVAPMTFRGEAHGALRGLWRQAERDGIASVADAAAPANAPTPSSQPRACKARPNAGSNASLKPSRKTLASSSKTVSARVRRGSR